MRTAAPPIFPIFRSDVSVRVVVELYLREEELTVSELARRVGTATSNVSKILTALRQAGITESRTVGRAVLVRANTDAPFYLHLRGLLEITYGPPVVLANTFANVPGIDEIYIFGSWAARAAGETGRTPADVDVLVVGHADRTAVFEAAREASKVLRRDVNPILTTGKAWARQEDSFLASLREGPMLRVAHDGSNDEHHPSRETDDRTDAGEWATALLPGGKHTDSGTS